MTRGLMEAYRVARYLVRAMYRTVRHTRIAHQTRIAPHTRIAPPRYLAVST